MLIKELPKEERPRERIAKYGASKLSNEELLSIILRCGTKNKSVKDLSRDILKEFNGLGNLKNSTINRLNNISGMGSSKSMVIVAMITTCIIAMLWNKLAMPVIRKVIC